MGIYNKDSNKPIVLPENPAADEVARVAHAKFQTDHADDVPVEPLFDADGRQVNFVNRVEVETVSAPSFIVTTFSDGTVRKDNRQPPAEKPAPITAASQYSFSQADQLRLSAQGVTKVHAGSGQGQVIQPTPAKNDPWRLLDN